MKRALTGIAAAAVVLGTMVPAAREVAPLMAQYPIPRKRPIWTCKKCGEKFRPNKSRKMCDRCIYERDRG